MRTCYLHVGAPKCGSTSIQNNLHASRSWLPEVGLIYPGLRKPRHNFLVTLFHPDPMSLRFNWTTSKNAVVARRGAARDQAVFEKEVEAHPDRDIVISNEVFFPQGEVLRLTELRAYLERFCDRVVVVVVTRDPVSLMNSRAQEQVKSGVRTYEAVLSNPQILDFRKTESYKAAFGTENLLLATMESLLAGGRSLMQGFGQLIGLDEAAAARLPDKRVNETLPLEAILLISELNKIAGVTVGLTQQADGGTGIVRGLGAKNFRGIGQTKFRLPKQAIKDKWDFLAKQYEYLDKELGIAYPVPDLDDWSDPAPVWDTATLGAIVAMANDSAAQLLRRTRQVRKLRNREEGEPEPTPAL